MKTKIVSLTILLGAMLFCALTTFASEKDSTKVEKKVIKIVKVDEKGTVVIDSTITTENGKTVIHVDTTSFSGMPCQSGGLKQMSHGNRMMHWQDDSGENYTIEVQSDGDSTHMMVIGGEGENFDMEKDIQIRPFHKEMMIRHGGNDLPIPPTPPVPPCHFAGKQGPGVIDLNDPSIISFEKKVQKDGTEKIAIVRKLQ